MLSLNIPKNITHVPTLVNKNKQILKDDNLFGVYWRHFWQKDSYPELSRFNYEEPAKKAK